MKELNLKNIKKVEIEHEYYKYSSITVCNSENYIHVINYLMSNNVKIINIKFYE